MPGTPVCTARLRPPLPRARTSGVPAAVSSGGGVGLPDFTREARGLGILSGSLGGGGMA